MKDTHTIISWEIDKATHTIISWEIDGDDDDDYKEHDNGGVDDEVSLEG